MSPDISFEFIREQKNDKNSPTCFSGVGEKYRCCGYNMIRYGKTKTGKQRFLCRNCRASRVLNSCKNGYDKSLSLKIAQLTKEGLGIRSTARVLEIAPATVVRKILQLAESLNPPNIQGCSEYFQIDELHTYVGNKKQEICVIYSWNKELKQAMSLIVGTRSKVNLRTVVTPLIGAGAKNINTDRYSGYTGVIPKKIHTTIKRRNNHIERQNLNLRTHLKRLNRRTICYSKSAAMLLAVVKIYFWG